MTTPLDAFLGFGLIRPFRRIKSDFASTGGRSLVESAAGQILGTRASGETMQGEIPWRPEFGSRFYLLKHRKGPAVAELALVYAREAFQRWEPRLTVTAVEAVFDTQRRATAIRIRFELIDQNVPGNQVIVDNGELEVPL
jgi:phage baseplate assembly protein W